MVYLIIVIPITIYVGRNLHKNGKVFLVHRLGGEEVANSVNQLLLVGFYLLNIGFVCLYLQTDEVLVGVRGVIEHVSQKIGVVMLVLGVIHIINLKVLVGFRRHLTAESIPTKPYKVKY